MSQSFGILAYPAGHSLSPVMHRAAFAELGIEASYDFFPVPPEQLAAFITRVRDERIAGLSVSIPHKIEIRPLLDSVDAAATQIGAVNTVYWQDSQLIGTNTDWIGAIETLETRVPTLAGKKVVLLGGGGAARAIVYGLQQRGAQVTVLTRQEWEYSAIAADFQIPADTIDHLDQYDPEILIHATPLGMAGEFADQSFVPADFFRTHQPLVFDIVYNPAQTRLLREARAAGCETLEGLGMLVRQGARQFTIWTGQPAPVATMLAAAEQALHAKE